MDLRRLRIFATVAELGNLSQAARRLNLSQPAASAQVKSLEDEFGITLFERKPKGLRLTRSGASLLPEVQKMLAISDGVIAAARGLSGRVTGPIKFAGVP